MSDESKIDDSKFVLQSTRFGDLLVAKDSVIEFPSGIIGFPKLNQYILIDHKPPFSWLHSVNEGSLAFVVVDGFEFGQNYDLSVPFSVKECEFNADDEYAILIICTIRPDPSQTTANLKAPLFINIRNKKGVQVIYDDSRYSTRHPLFLPEKKEEESK